MRRSSLLHAAAVVAGCALGAPPASAQTLPNLAYQDDEVFSVLSVINGDVGAPRGHGTMALHQGYLAVVFSRDSGAGDGGFAFIDVSDPRNPVEIYSRDDDVTEDIREAHGYGFVKVNGRTYVALQATKGLQIWDWTDVQNPTLVNYMDLPGIEKSDYDLGAWWTSWQWPYIYVGGSANGLYIVDASDPANPVLAEREGDAPNPVPNTLLGSFKFGPVFAMGNLLGIAAMQQVGYATADISDPLNPRLMSSLKVGATEIYAGQMNGEYLYGATTSGAVEIVDISDPFNITLAGRSEIGGDRGGYLTVQDDFVIAGISDQVGKFDVSDKTNPILLGTTSADLPGHDEDFATVLGNLIFIGDDHGSGSGVIPHQKEPDTNPPMVNNLSPAASAVGVPLTSRIGFSFSDQIDFETVDGTTVVVQEAGGSPIEGVYSYQTNILNFSPSQPLKENTTYEIIVQAGGIRDVAGNPIAETFTSLFSTGGVVVNPDCSIDSDGPVAQGSSAELSANVSGSGLMYSWDFGDGSERTAPSNSPNVSYSYPEPGHYTVIVLVSDQDGVVTTCTKPQTVHRPVVGDGTRSSTLLLDEARQRVWVANPDHDSVSVIDVEGQTLIAETPVGQKPRAVAQAPDGSVWAVSDWSAELHFLDPETGAVDGSLALPRGSRPSGVVFTPDGSKGYVSLRGTGKVLELEPTERQLERELDVGGEPWGLAVSHDSGELWVTNFMSPADRAELHVISTADFTLSRTEELVVDPGPDTEASSRGVLNYLRSVTFSPDGFSAWVPAKKDNTGRGWWNDLEPLTFESTVRTSVAQVSPSGSGERLERRLDLDDRALPAAVTLSPLGDFAFVALEGSKLVQVIDAYSGQEVSGLQVGHAPDGLVSSSDGSTMYVHSFLSRQLSVIDVSEIVGAGSNQAETLAEISTVSSEVLSQEVLLGKQIFYDASDSRMSQDGYLSCAVCHLDGEHDGRIWDFSNRGEGLRNTTTLLGSRGQAPLHWTGNFDEVQDFEHDIRDAFGGTGFMSDEDFAAGRDTSLGEVKSGVSPELDALAAYVESLESVPNSPYRKETGHLTDDAKLGAQIFEDLGCDECHGGDDYTDSATDVRHDVGTLTAASGQRLWMPLDGIDTPTLRGLWATAPYLHDGSATTLDEVLKRSGSKHGGAKDLSEDERGQLLAYLLQIDDSNPGPEPEPDPDPEPEPGATASSKKDDGGCGCSTVGARGPDASWLLLLPLLGWARRRRSHARRSRRWLC